MSPLHTSRPPSAYASPTPPAAMPQALGGAMNIMNSSLAYLTGCTITNSTASGSEVRLAPVDEGAHAAEAAHEASPHQSFVSALLSSSHAMPSRRRKVGASVYRPAN
jgi:hypothetical protein